MSFNHTTPIKADGVRLFYRTKYNVQNGMVGGHYKGPIFIPPKNNSEKGLFKFAESSNVIAQICLYRWFLKEYERVLKRSNGVFSGSILKEDLMGQCFEEWPNVNKHRVGRLLRLIIQYETNFQRNRHEDRPTQMFWRWTHPLDIVYGIEHLMAIWLPKVILADGGSCSTDEEFQEELEIIRDQTTEEIDDMVSMINEKRLF